ncbi:hypothetical protein [Winslowiella iniecta]|uniref:hypothetical protein n=1 Tax=Winslowiella iniecta TaxID=1560201 RepID=UPI000ACC3197|nr:hypothetical protein [Winslowiella iniecta]
MVGEARSFELNFSQSEEHLSAAGNVAAGQRESWKQARAYIDDPASFTHNIVGYRIESEDLHYVKREKNNYFVNKFKPKKWTFRTNFREHPDVPYYASDVARYQYERVSAEHDFTTMPEVIKRKRIANELTPDETEGLEGDEIFAAFFRTPVGKSTQRIMAGFNRTSFAVDRNDDDFYVRLNRLDI